MKAPTKDQIKERLLSEGFSDIHEYNDPPNEEFPDHGHSGDQLLIVLSGSITIRMNGETSTLKAGEEQFFPANVPHSAQIGPEGCFYIDGERPN